METAPGLIPTRNKSEAMDWSLVLASQEIESTILHDPDEDRWGLKVEASQFDLALAAIAQYQRENRFWRWRQRIPSRADFHWEGALWCLFLVLMHLLAGPRLRDAGIMDGQAFRIGEWWRLFSAVTLHADAAHLATNAAVGVLLFGLMLGIYGGAGLMAALLAGAAGNVLGFFVYPEPYRALGASGMVMGALGLLAAQSIPYRARHPGSGRRIFAALAGGVMIFLLLGANPNSDLVAHLGGFIAGCAFGWPLAGIGSRRLLKPLANACGWFGVAFLTTLAWWLAARSAGG